jgi:hypothetical protein
MAVFDVLTRKYNYLYLAGQLGDKTGNYISPIHILTKRAKW